MQVEYDPDKISYNKLLNKFWSEHSYSHRSKTQYKSAVFVHSEEQRAAVDASKTKLEQQGKAVATDVIDAPKWYDAEEYHQHYVAKQRGSRSR